LEVRILRAPRTSRFALLLESANIASIMAADIKNGNSIIRNGISNIAAVIRVKDISPPYDESGRAT
jgi:hypothetical protein